MPDFFLAALAFVFGVAIGRFWWNDVATREHRAIVQEYNSALDCLNTAIAETEDVYQAKARLN